MNVNGYIFVKNRTYDIRNILFPPFPPFVGNLSLYVSSESSDKTSLDIQKTSGLKQFLLLANLV